jgi:PadR family transcriptional regulator AphA
MLAKQSAHGYDLHLRLVTELGFIWHVSLSQVYNILNRLEAQGCIFGNTYKQTHRPDRRIFTVTESGLQRFETWLHAPTPCAAHAIRLEFTTRLYFLCQRNPLQAVALIERQTPELQARIEDLRGFLGAIPTGQVINRLGLELRISQLENILDWLQHCSGEIAPLPSTS